MNRSARVLGILIIAQAALLCSTFDQWSTLGTFVVLVVGLVLWNQQLRHQQVHSSHESNLVSPVKPIFVMLAMLVIAVVCVAWRVPGALGDGANVVAVAVDTIAHIALLSSLMLWSLRPSRGHLLMPFLGLALILLCVASGGVSRSLQAQTTVGVLTCLGFVAAAKIVFPGRQSVGQWGQIYQFSGGPGLRSDNAWRQRRVAVIATVTVLMMVTGAVASVTEIFLPAIQHDLQNRLQSTIEAVEHNRLVGGMRYVRGSSLGSVRRHLTHDPQAIVMVVYADQRPGYLRGNVFDLYRESRWYCDAEQVANDLVVGSPRADRTVVPSGHGQVKLNSRAGAKLNRFQLLPVDSGRQAQMEIVGDPMRGNSAFMPLGARWIEASSYSLTVTCHQSIRVGVDTSKPYVIGAEAGSAQVVLTPTERMLLTDVAPEQREALVQIADTLFEKAESTAEKAAAVQTYFQSSFTYGLESISRPPSVDPIMYFLNSRHPAHCEYFATATVLLLRAAGVPTRYVVGYVSDEESDDSGRWLARNRDAHAWAEAYDDKTQRWFAVESTPGRSYQSVSPPGALALQSQTQAGQLGEKDSSSKIGEFLSSVWGYLFSLRATDTFFALFRYAQIVILIGLVGWLVGRIKRANESPREAAERACRKMLGSVDRMLGCKGFVRAPSESLYQFADRVEHGLSQSKTERYTAVKREQMQRAAQWLRTFADSRYQGMMPRNWTG